MSWSTPIARIFGTELRIHFTFVIFLVWIAAARWVAGGPSAALEGVAFIVLVFACVVAHEFGHALVARRYGIATPTITLLPIGGIASLSSIPEKPGEEIAIALAGPAVNVAIALVLIVLLGTHADVAALESLDSPGFNLVAALATVNIVLVVFNLIPAFPMDGGRVLRALLAMRYPRVKATQVAAKVGQVLAIGFGIAGLFGNPFLLLIAVFVYIAASGEAQATALQETGQHVGVSEAMITHFEPLTPDAAISDAVHLLLTTTQREFPVLDGAKHLVGALTREGMVRALSETGAGTRVGDVMVREVPVVRHRQALAAALPHLQTGTAPLVGVVDADGRLIGYLTLENVGELMMVRAA